MSGLSYLRLIAQQAAFFNGELRAAIPVLLKLVKVNERKTTANRPECPVSVTAGKEHAKLIVVCLRHYCM